MFSSRPICKLINDDPAGLSLVCEVQVGQVVRIRVNSVQGKREFELLEVRIQSVLIFRTPEYSPHQWIALFEGNRVRICFTWLGGVGILFPGQVFKHTGIATLDEGDGIC